jgi:hypothetical protein
MIETFAELLEELLTPITHMGISYKTGLTAPEVETSERALVRHAL